MYNVHYLVVLYNEACRIFCQRTETPFSNRQHNQPAYYYYMHMYTYKTLTFIILKGWEFINDGLSHARFYIICRSVDANKKIIIFDTLK